MVSKPTSYKMTLTVTFGNYNDHDEANATIASIRATAHCPVDVIVIDDGSPTPFACTDPMTRVVRCDRRIGSGPARALGAELAKDGWVLSTDSHMRFVPGWTQAIQQISDGPKDTVWCGSCLGLAPGRMNLADAQGCYNGATMHFAGTNPSNAQQVQVMEGKWTSDKPGDHYDLAMIMGALYLSHKSWIQHVKPWSWLKMWGSEEPSLGLRTWKLGGSCKMLKGLQAGHQFRTKSFHSAPSACNLYNKLRIAHSVMPYVAYQTVLRESAREYLNSGDRETAARWLAEDNHMMVVDKAFMEENTKLSFEGYLERFSLPKFWV